MTTKDIATVTAGLFVIALFLAAVVGWALNIAAVIHSANDPITGMFIVRCIGIIVAPAGAILGWI